MSELNLKSENFWAIVLGIIAVLALTIKLLITWFSFSDLLDILVNFAQVGVAVIVFIVAVSIKKKSESFIEIGKHALESIQKKFPTFLVGPKYNRENYDPEKGKGLQYLFITNPDPKSKLRAKFIPLDPLSEGILTIYIQKATLVYGLNIPSEQATPELIMSIQKSINDELMNFIQNKFVGHYEILPPPKDDTAIIIDFNEESLKQKKYFNAIVECADIAINALLKYKK